MHSGQPKGLPDYQVAAGSKEASETAGPYIRNQSHSGRFAGDPKAVVLVEVEVAQSPVERRSAMGSMALHGGCHRCYRVVKIVG